MKRVYMCFSTDIIHAGHVSIISKAAALGELTVGVLADSEIAAFKRYPLIPIQERIEMFKNIKGVTNVVVQEELEYTNILYKLRPDILVHGDDWKTGFQAVIRERAIEVMSEWGGILEEFAYSYTPTEDALSSLDHMLSMPENRRKRLKKLLQYKSCLSVMEAHNGLTGLIVENAKVNSLQGVKQFDAIWVSSLCDSTVKGKPDIELVDMTSRVTTLEEIMEVTTKPIILDGDTGGQISHFVFNIRTLERIGVSAIIVEDKCGLKKNSLFGIHAKQVQESTEVFCEKISAGKAALRTRDFMIFARCESLILNQGIDNALDRCHSYVKAGADGIMIHSCKKDPAEILEFCKRFRMTDMVTPLVAVPTTYNEITEEELAQVGINIVIHANHLLRSAFYAMEETAKSILINSRSYEVDKKCLTIKEILTLIPEN